MKTIKFLQESFETKKKDFNKKLTLNIFIIEIQ